MGGNGKPLNLSKIKISFTHSRIQNEPDVLSLLLISCFSTEQLYQEQKLFLYFCKLLNVPGFFQ